MIGRLNHVAIAVKLRRLEHHHAVGETRDPVEAPAAAAALCQQPRHEAQHERADRSRASSRSGRGADLRGEQAAFAGATGPMAIENIAQQGLDAPTMAMPHRPMLESAFGSALGPIPVHSGPGAEIAARELDAEAFAFNGHIVLGSGRGRSLYRPACRSAG